MNVVKYLQHKYTLVSVFVISILMLLLPSLLRVISFSNHIVYGPDSYADLILVNQGLQTDNLYVMLLKSVSNIAPLENAAIFMPIMFGVLSLVLFYAILRTFELKRENKIIIMFLLSFSPIFIYTFTYSSFLSLSAFLSLLSMYLITKKEPVLKYLSLCPLLALIWIGIYEAFIVLAVSLFYEIRFAKKKTQFASYKHFTIIGACTIILLLLRNIFIHTGELTLSHISDTNFLQNNITDLGSILGFGIFTVLLLLLGLYATFKRQRNFYALYFLLGLLMFFSWLAPKYRIYLNFMVVFFAGYGLSHLLKRNWEIVLLKNICIFILVLGIIFSGFSFVNRLESNDPSKELIDEILWLNELPLQGRVLSHEQYGYIIDYHFTEQAAFLRPDSLQYQFTITSTIFHSRNTVLTTNLLKENTIQYIIITQDMKNGLVWSKESQGLLFLLENSEKFKKIRSSKHIEIWEFEQ